MYGAVLYVTGGEYTVYGAMLYVTGGEYTSVWGYALCNRR